MSNFLIELREWMRLPADVRGSVMRAILLPEETSKQNRRLWTTIGVFCVGALIPLITIGYVGIQKMSPRIEITRWVFGVGYWIFVVDYITSYVVQALRHASTKRTIEMFDRMRAHIMKELDNKTQIYLDELKRRSGRTSVNNDPISAAAATLESIDNERKKMSAGENNPLRAALNDIPSEPEQ